MTKPSPMKAPSYNVKVAAVEQLESRELLKGGLGATRSTSGRAAGARCAARRAMRAMVDADNGL